MYSRNLETHDLIFVGSAFQWLENNVGFWLSQWILYLPFVNLNNRDIFPSLSSV